MKKFHLMHCIPNLNHEPNGYKEVVDTIRWGLEQLGYEVSYAVNSYNPSCTNIIFGAQMLPIEMMSHFSDNTIIYNLEQLRGLEPFQIRPEIHFCAKHFEVWEYSREHLKAWESIGNTTAKLVPIGYAPILTQIIKPVHQDIDVLIYGSSGEQRLKAFDLLAKAGLSSVFVCGLYGESRDNLIARSKIVLNINILPISQIFEIVRVSYLLANKKAVVATLDANTAVEDDIKSCIKFSTLENLVADCSQLIDNDTMRTNFENSGFEVFSHRDIRNILKNTLY